MNLPTIGFGSDAGVKIDLDALIVSRMLIQANSGGGKSYAIRYIAESTVGRVQQIIIDREGEFATLREKFPYALIGREGDAAADLRSAKLLARTLMELRLSAVIDISEMSITQQREYVAELVNAINHLPRALWHDCLIFIDEAHLFAPETGKGSSAASEAIALLLSIGRKRGYCAILATQRLSKLSKDVAAECLNKLIGRTSNEDLRRAADELGQGKEASRDLRSLEKGQFWAYGPAIAPDPVLVLTGDVQTEPPKRGEARAPAPPAPHKIKAALAQLADLPKQADEEARTLAGMQRENGELKRRVAQLEKGGVVQTVEKPVVDQLAMDKAVADAVDRERAGFERQLAKVRGAIPLNDVRHAIDSLAVVLGKCEAIGTDANAAWDTTRQKRLAEQREPYTRSASTVVKREAKAPALSVRRESDPAAVASSGDLSSGEVRILDALAELEVFGIFDPSRIQAGIVAGLTLTGGTSASTVGRLVERGYLQIPAPGKLTLTSTGRAVTTPPGSLSLSELHDRALAKLSGAEAKILSELIAVYPDSRSRVDLGATVGLTLTGGTSASSVGKLVSLQFVMIPKPGQLRASDVLFPEGLS